MSLILKDRLTGTPLFRRTAVAAALVVAAAGASALPQFTLDPSARNRASEGRFVPCRAASTGARREAFYLRQGADQRVGREELTQEG